MSSYINYTQRRIIFERDRKGVTRNLRENIREVKGREYFQEPVVNTVSSLFESLLVEGFHFSLILKVPPGAVLLCSISFLL